MGKIKDNVLKKEVENVYFNQLCKSKRLTYTEVTEVAKYFVEWTLNKTTENLIEGTIGETQNKKFVRIKSYLGTSAIPLPENISDNYNLGDTVKLKIVI